MHGSKYISASLKFSFDITIQTLQSLEKVVTILKNNKEVVTILRNTSLVFFALYDTKLFPSFCCLYV